MAQSVSDEAVTAIIAIATGAIGITIISVLVSKNAQTPQVLQAAGSAFSGILGAATAPVTGGSALSFGGGSTISPISLI